MILILLLLSIGSFFVWGTEMVEALKSKQNYPDPNTVFYTDFFSIMIFIDVLLLIISFIYHFSFSLFLEMPALLLCKYQQN
jgi:hypothetical protein